MSPKPFGFVIAPEYSTTVGRGGGAMMPTAEYIESRLPASEDAERAILGSITLSPEGYEIAVAMGLTAAEMSLTSHRHIYSAIAVMREAGRHVDLVTLTAELAERKQLETIGGVAYMSALLDAVPDWSNIRAYVKTVRKKAKLRALIHACDTTITSAFDGMTARDCINQLGEQLLQIQTDSTDGALPGNARESLPLVFEDMP